MDYSPLIWSILVRFESGKFLPEIYFKDHFNNFEVDSTIVGAKLESKLNFFRRGQNRHETMDYSPLIRSILVKFESG